MNKKIFFYITFFLQITRIISNDIVLLPFFDSPAALQFIKKYLPENPVIVEAGAFDGNETVLMSNIWPKGIIHAFEPVPMIFKWLKQNTVNCNNVQYYFYALSNKTGTAKFYLSEDPKNPNIPISRQPFICPVI